MGVNLWNTFNDPLGLLKKKEEEEQKKKLQKEKLQKEKVQYAYSHNAPDESPLSLRDIPPLTRGATTPAVQMPKVVEENSPYAIKFDTSSTANAVPLPLEGKAVQRGNRGARSESLWEKYKKQAAKNSYNIRRETALKNDGYFKELANVGNISADRRAFLENELDLYARDDKDWYSGRALREAQQREKDEFNRLSALVKTPEWKMMTPGQQAAERAKLEDARADVAKHKSAGDTRRLEAYWEENKDAYIAKVKEGDVLTDLKFSVPYGGKYEALSDEEKAKLLCINDFYSMPENGGFLRSGYRAEKYMEEKADERTERKVSEDFRLQQAWEAKDMQGNVLPNAGDIRNGYIEKGRNAEWHPLNVSDNPLERAAQGSMKQDILNVYNSLSDDEKMYVDFLSGYYDNEADFGREFNAFLQGKRNETFKESAEKNGFVRNFVAPLKSIGTSLAGSVPMVLGAAAQAAQNYYTGYNDPVHKHSPGMLMLDTAESDKQAWLGNSTGWVRKAKEFGLGMVDTMVPMATGPVAAPFIYAAKSAGQSAYETTKKGGSADKALKMAALDGAVTYFVAKGPVEHLFSGMASTAERAATKQSFGKALAKYLTMQGASEGAEGVIESYSHTLFDTIINRDNSDIMRSYKALVADGNSHEDAMKKAMLVHLAIDPAVSGAMEALGGLVMAGGKVGIDVAGSLISSADVSYEGGGVVANDKTTVKDIMGQLSSGGVQADEDYAGGVLEHIRSERDNIPEVNRKMLEAYSKKGRVKVIVGDTANLTGQESAGAFTRVGNAIIVDWKTAQDNNKLARAIVNHEAVHATETSRFYEALKEYAFSHMFKSEAEKNAAIAKKTERYAKSGVTLDKAGAEAELVARYIGESLLTRPEAVDLFVKQNGSLARQVYEGLVNTYNRVKTYFADRESYEARYALSDIEQGIRLFEKAFGTRRTALDEVSEKYGWSGGSGGGDVQYDIRKDKRGTEYWHIETEKDIFKGIKDNTELLQKRAFDYLLSNNKRFIVEDVVDGEKLEFVRIGAKKYVYGDHTDFLTMENYNKKMRMAPSIYDLIENSTSRWESPNHKESKKINKYGYKNYAGYVEIDNVPFHYIVRVGKGTDGKYFYEMNLEVSDAIKVPDIRMDASLQLPLTSKKMIPQMKPIVKSQMQEALEKAGLNDWQRAKPIVHGMREQGLVDSKGNVLHFGDRVITANNEEGVVTRLDKYGNAEVTFEIEGDEYIVQRFSSDDDYNVKELTRTNLEKEKRVADIADSGSADRVPSPGKGLYEYGARKLMTKEEAENARQEMEKPTVQEPAAEVRIEEDNPAGAAVAEAIENAETETGGAEMYEKASAAETQQEKSADENNVRDSFKTVKARKYYMRHRNEFKEQARKVLGVPGKSIDKADAELDAYAKEYFEKGTVSRETKDNLFEKLWSEGVVIDDSMGKVRKEIREQLKKQTLYIDEKSWNKNYDFTTFRLSQIGNMAISTTKGYSVDAMYQELSDSYRDLFPENITASSDRLIRIAQVMQLLKPAQRPVRDMYNKEDKAGFKSDFERKLEEFNAELNYARRYDEEAGKVKVNGVFDRPELTVQEAIAVQTELKKYKNILAKVQAKYVLTEDDNRAVENLLNGVVTEEQLNPSLNVEGIKAVYKAKLPVRHLESLISGHREAAKNKYRADAERFIENSDKWKDKGSKFLGGFRYGRETMERNMQDVIKNDAEADAFNEHYFEPVHINEAKSNRFKNEYRSRVMKLNLSDKVQKGNKTSERFAVQFLGEIESDIARLSQKKLYGIFDKRIGSKGRFATQNEIDRYIDYAYLYAYETNEKGNREFQKQIDRIIISKADERLINEIRESYGVDLSDAYHTLRDNDIRHIKKSHGEETNEKYPVTTEDLKKIPDIIENYDDVIYLPKDGKAGLYYVKRHNGTTYYLESINEEGTALTNKQMIKVPTGTIPDIPGLRDAINKKWNIDSSPNGNNVPRVYVQDVQNTNVPENSVSQNEKNVNHSKKSTIRELFELQTARDKFLEENPNLDTEKINKAVEEFRKIYDELFEGINAARVQNGYQPMEYRQGYFPHFLLEEESGVFEKAIKALGVEVKETNLPTAIAGKTQDFKPGIRFMTNALQRKGNKTDYDAVMGFDRYIETAADVIYHTEDIQKLRALENAIRFKHSESGVAEEIEKLKNDNTITFDDKNERIEELKARSMTHLGGLVQEVSEYANLLANKKSKYDRGWEQFAGRTVYNLFNWMNSRAAANMIAGNLSSAFTNAIPITQASAEVGTGNLLKATADTVKSFVKNDGFMDKSTFLTNRRGSDILTKTKLDKAADIASKPMEWIDMFASNVVTRAKYEQNIKRGMSEAEAMRDADKFATGLIADRSKGALPTIFAARNPLAKSFTMFQVEVNNQLSYLFKDLPKAKRAGAVKSIAGALFSYFIGANIYNYLYKLFVGREPALDPIGLANDVVGGFAGVKARHLFEVVAVLVRGGGTELTGDFKGWLENSEHEVFNRKYYTKEIGRDLKDLLTVKVNDAGVQKGFSTLGKGVAEQMPFTGVLTGGGRIPVTSGVSGFVDGAETLLSSDVDKKKKLEVGIGAAFDAAGYYLSPFGYNQAKKTVKGVATVAAGGSYKRNSKGEKQLQYPVYNDNKVEQLRNFVQAGLFGKSALPEAQRWVDNGFDTLNAKDTERYDKIKGKGKNREMYETILKLGDVQPFKDADGNTVFGEDIVRHEMIQNSSVESGKKAWLEMTYWTNEQREKAAKAEKDAGITADDYVNVNYMSKLENRELLREYLTDRQKRMFDVMPGEEDLSEYERYALMNDGSFTPEQKSYINRELLKGKAFVDFTDLNTFVLSQMTQAQNRKYAVVKEKFGISPDVYKYYVTVGNKGKNEKGKKAMLEANGMSSAAAEVFYDVALKDAYEGDVHDKTAYNNMSARERSVYDQLKVKDGYEKMKTSDFAYYMTVIKNLKSDEDKVHWLMKCYVASNTFLTEAQAKEIVKMLK